MSYFMVDIEADGPAPGEYSMLSLGAVLVRPGLEQRFFAEFKPVSDKFIPEALAVSAYTREETLAFPNPETGMKNFEEWVLENSKRRPVFVSDNNGFDWMFVCWYFHRFLNRNPFGFSSVNLGSLYKGMVKDTFKSFKHLRDTKHSHHPVDDALGNAEALLKMKALGLKIRLD